MRVIAASNRDLAEAVRSGGMRADFRQRLGVPIETTPLRSRREDIPILAHYLLDRLVTSLGKNVSSISPEAMRCLFDYDWPGNGRELRNALRNALLLCGERIEVKDLQLDPALTARSAQALPTLAQLEKVHLEQVLAATRGHQGQAAKILGVSEDTVKAMMDRYGLERGAFRN